MRTSKPAHVHRPRHVLHQQRVSLHHAQRIATTHGPCPDQPRRQVVVQLDALLEENKLRRHERPQADARE
jgi:hypothetical protein